MPRLAPLGRQRPAGRHADRQGRPRRHARPPAAAAPARQRRSPRASRGCAPRQQLRHGGTGHPVGECPAAAPVAYGPAPPPLTGSPYAEGYHGGRLRRPRHQARPSAAAAPARWCQPPPWHGRSSRTQSCRVLRQPLPHRRPCSTVAAAAPVQWCRPPPQHRRCPHGQGCRVRRQPLPLRRQGGQHRPLLLVPPPWVAAPARWRQSPPRRPFRA